jgi:Uma2 family endonuclease
MTVKPRYTAADLEAFPEDNVRREVIGGELFVPPVPDPYHQRASMILGWMIESHLQSMLEPPGLIFTAPFDVTLGLDGVQPDLVYVSNDRLHYITDKKVAGPPDWAIEILLSNRKYDLDTKHSLYRRSGVIAYWAVDLVAERVHAWDWRSGTEKTFERDAKATVSVLPGLEIDLSSLFAKIEALRRTIRGEK